VNPFELKEKTESSVSVIKSSQTIDSGDFSVVVIEDSLQQPSINENIEEVPSQEIPVETTIVEATSEIIVNEPDVDINPFELQNQEDSGLGSDNIVADDSIENLDTLSSDTITSDSIQNGALIDEISTIEESKSAVKVPTPNDGRNLIVFFACLFCGLLIAISLNARNTILSDIWKSFTNLNYMKLLQKEQQNGWSTPYIILYVVYLINVSFFIRFLCVHYELPLMKYSLWKIGLLILALLSLRHLSLYVLTFMRKRLNETLNYNFIIISINIITGLLLIPINLFLAYSGPGIVKVTLFVGIGIMSISFLTRWFRAFINSLRIIIGDSFHFLLYLCSCEIVPIIIMLGYLRNLIS
jgi:hypothetical protein